MARHLLATAALVGLVGCSSGEVKLGVDVASVDAARAASLAVTDPTIDPGNSAANALDLEITRVRLLLAHAKVGYTGGGKDGADADVGPVVVELTAEEVATGARRELSLGTIASGTYGGAELEIMPLDTDVSDSSFDDFRASGASILVDGIYKEAAFTFQGHFLAEQGTDGEVTIDSSSPTVLSLTVDPTAWFLDDAGAVLDPNDAANQGTIAVAICKSLDTQVSAGGPSGGGKHGGGEAHCVEASN